VPERPYLLVDDLAALAPSLERGIHSQTVIEADVRVVLFSFAAGEELSEHTAARPAIVHVLSGSGNVTVAGDAFAAGPGTWFRMDARTPHSIRASEALVMLLYLLPAG
jgi:quercetin dioxygenase-like cupin family protein